MLCYSAECRILFTIILNAIVLSVIVLNVVMLNVAMLSVVAPLNWLATATTSCSHRQQRQGLTFLKFFYLRHSL
jgi:hypothetical protein